LVFDLADVAEEAGDHSEVLRPFFSCIGFSIIWSMKRPSGEGTCTTAGANSLRRALLSGDIGEQIQLVARFEGLGPRFDLGK